MTLVLVCTLVCACMIDRELYFQSDSWGALFRVKAGVTMVDYVCVYISSHACTCIISFLYFLLPMQFVSRLCGTAPTPPHTDCDATETSVRHLEQG